LVDNNKALEITENKKSGVFMGLVFFGFGFVLFFWFSFCIVSGIVCICFCFCIIFLYNIFGFCMIEKVVFIHNVRTPERRRRVGVRGINRTAGGSRWRLKTPSR
jgi:hypothetical protein